jgi:hypothetical protein
MDTDTSFPIEKHTHSYTFSVQQLNDHDNLGLTLITPSQTHQQWNRSQRNDRGENECEPRPPNPTANETAASSLAHETGLIRDFRNAGEVAISFLEATGSCFFQVRDS